MNWRHVLAYGAFRVVAELIMAGLVALALGLVLWLAGVPMSW